MERPLSWVGLALSVCLAGCAPAAPKVDLDAALYRLSARAYGEPDPTYEDAPLTAYLQGITDRLARHAGRADLRVRVAITDLPRINAEAAWVRINVDRGMLALANDEAEIAAVLGHELGHLVTRQQLFEIVNEWRRGDEDGPFRAPAAVLAFEMQADRLGLHYLRSAGYAPRAVIRVLRSLKRAAVAQHDNHFTLPQRIAHAFRQGADTDGGEVGRDAYLDHVDGLVHSERPAEGAPLRIRVRRVKVGGPFAQVMPTLCQARRPIEELALLNGVEGETPIAAGTRLKCVER